MLADRGFWTSATRLAPYENCPLQFLHGNLLEIARSRSAAMSLGGIFHDVLEAFHDPAEPGPLTLERLLELADEKWSDEGMGPRPVCAENRRLLETLLRNYYEHEVVPGLEGEVLAVEQRFRFDLDETTLTGYIDRIDRLDDGRLRLLDYKTSKNAMQKRRGRARPPARPLRARVRGRPRALRARARWRSSSICTRARSPTESWPAAASRVTPTSPTERATRIRELVAAIRAERFDFSPEADCGWCEFKQLCPRHHGKQVPV